MAARDLFVFKHGSALGEAPAQRLFDMVTARTREGVETPALLLQTTSISGPQPEKDCPKEWHYLPLCWNPRC